MIFAAKNSIKFQKTRFWKEKSVEDVGTLGPTTAQTTLVTVVSTSLKAQKSATNLQNLDMST